MLDGIFVLRVPRVHTGLSDCEGARAQVTLDAVIIKYGSGEQRAWTGISLSTALRLRDLGSILVHEIDSPDEYDPRSGLVYEARI